MKYVFVRRFTNQLASLPPGIQTKFWKQLTFLLQDLHHPSLRAKRHNEAQGIWQARVDRNYRFYFLIEDDMYILLDIRSHPK